MSVYVVLIVIIVSRGFKVAALVWCGSVSDRKWKLRITCIHDGRKFTKCVVVMVRGVVLVLQKACIWVEWFRLIGRSVIVILNKHTLGM